MNSLLVDLYRYRQREKKENQEDWLTECIAAILRSLPADPLATVLHRLTRQPREAILRVSGQIVVETQKTINRGADRRRQRPDMLVSIGETPWLLFENKVFHSVAREEHDEGEIETQLHRYGGWLQRQAFPFEEGLARALLFVTYGSITPPDFVDRHGDHRAYSGLGRHASTWGQLGRLFAEATAYLDDAMHARVLVIAYNHYLEHHGMADDYPAYSDLAGLGTYVEKSDLFAKLVDDMFARARDFAPSTRQVTWAEPQAEDGSFIAYRYLSGCANYNAATFIATGLWFPERGNGWYRREIEEEGGVPVSPVPKVVVQLGNDEEHALKRLEGLPGEGWYRPLSEFVTFRDFASFPGDPTERANAIFAWLDEELAKLKKALG